MLSTRTQQTQRSSSLRPVAARTQTLRRLSSAPDRDRRGHGGATQAVEALRGPGRPLDARARVDLEHQFGYDFSNVRVHTDEPAARASRGIGAVAYTSGTDIAFDTGRYAPHSPAGRALLAHELTHVAQQSHASPEGAPVIAPAGDAAEHEADHTAAVVASGGQLTGPVSASGAAIQRASVGGVLGGIGLGIVGLVGLAAAAVGLEMLFRGSRGLNDHEKGEAQKVFGNSLNFGAVRLAESTLMTIGGNIARTPGNTVYFPPGTLKKLEAQEKTTPPPDVNEYRRLMHWLIHETTHTWQTQHGVSMWTKLRTAMRGSGHGAVYDYKGPDGLRKALAAGQHFVDFNTEQQADICADYWLAKYDGGDVSAYLPFIAEVKNGGMPVAPRPEFNDAPMPSGETMMA
jgi:hypothetical protein